MARPSISLSFLRTIYYKMCIFFLLFVCFFVRCWLFWDKARNMFFWIEGAVPLWSHNHLPDSSLCRHTTRYLPDGLSPPQRCPSIILGFICCQDLFHYSIHILVLIVLSDREWALTIERPTFFQGAASTFECASPVLTGIGTRYCMT